MATKKQRSQVSNALLRIFECCAILIIGSYSAFQVYLHGAGTRGRSRGLKGLFARWLYSMEDQGNDTLVKAILLGMFGFAALCALFWLVYYLLHLTPARTKLGRSVRRQAASYEKLPDLIRAIDTDMDQDSREFGTELRIGSQWLLSEEAMRINRIRKISIKDKGKNHCLLVTDLDGCTLEVAFSRPEALSEAAYFLQRRLPDAGEGVEMPEIRIPDTYGGSFGAAENAVPAEGPMASEARNSEAGSLQDIQNLQALAFAAPLRAVTYEYQKELGSESPSKGKEARMRKKLEKQWKIGDSFQLTEKIRELYLGEKATEYDELLQILAFPVKDDRRKFLIDRKIEYEWREAFLTMLENAEALFNRFGVYFPGPEDTLYAWDLVNAAVLAVHGARAGYLTAEEELAALSEVGRLAGLYYSSWESYAGAFLLAYFFDTFFKEDSPDFAVKFCAGKGEVKEIRSFLKDKSFMSCPFGLHDKCSGPGLPKHYQPKQYL